MFIIWLAGYSHILYCSSNIAAHIAVAIVIMNVAGQ